MNIRTDTALGDVLNIRWTLHDLLVEHDRRNVRLMEERRPAGEHHEDGHTEYAPAHALVVLRVADDLCVQLRGVHAQLCRATHLRHKVVWRLDNGGVVFCKAKVCDLDVAVEVDENVLRLQIAMSCEWRASAASAA